MKSSLKSINFLSQGEKSAIFASRLKATCLIPKDLKMYWKQSCIRLHVLVSNIKPSSCSLLSTQLSNKIKISTLQPVFRKQVFFIPCYKSERTQVPTGRIGVPETVIRKEEATDIKWRQSKKAERAKGTDITAPFFFPTAHHATCEISTLSRSAFSWLMKGVAQISVFRKQDMSFAHSLCSVLLCLHCSEIPVIKLLALRNHHLIIHNTVRKITHN